MAEEKEQETEKKEITIDINILQEEGFDILPNENIKLIITESDEGIS